MKRSITILIIGIFSTICFAEVPQSSDVDSSTGASTWRIKNQGVYFSLTEILPDQARAFYVNRGFTLEQIEPFATSCVYMAVLRNDNAPGTIHFISNQWTVLVDGKKHPLTSVDDWIKKLAYKNSKQSALIAFRWAQFPVEQEYEPGGDWNQGMLSVGLAPGSQFDIVARWDIEGKVYESRLEGVTCAK
jgi:hypothetical protein